MALRKQIAGKLVEIVALVNVKPLDDIIPMLPGVALFTPAYNLHKFRTTQDKLTVICFHPNSDIGFTHTEYLMLNQTLISGISASHPPEIQTNTRFLK